MFKLFKMRFIDHCLVVKDMIKVEFRSVLPMGVITVEIKCA